MIDLALLIQERGYSSRVLMSVNVKILICRKRRKRALAIARACPKRADFQGMINVADRLDHATLF